VKPVVVLADALALVRELLRTAPELTGVPVVLSSPRDTSAPWVRLTRIGGSEATVPVPVLEIASFDVACFAPPEVADASRVAHDLARRCVGVLRAAPGYELGSGHITRVELTTGPAWEPDETRNPPTPRFVFTVSVFVRSVMQEVA
jgi:hypothetical protein